MARQGKGRHGGRCGRGWASVQSQRSADKGGCLQTGRRGARRFRRGTTLWVACARAGAAARRDARSSRRGAGCRGGAREAEGPQAGPPAWWHRRRRNPSGSCRSFPRRALSRAPSARHDGPCPQASPRGPSAEPAPPRRQGRARPQGRTRGVGSGSCEEDISLVPRQTEVSRKRQAWAGLQHLPPARSAGPLPSRNGRGPASEPHGRPGPLEPAQGHDLFGEDLPDLFRPDGLPGESVSARRIFPALGSLQALHAAPWPRVPCGKASFIPDVLRMKSEAGDRPCAKLRMAPDRSRRYGKVLNRLAGRKNVVPPSSERGERTVSTNAGAPLFDARSAEHGPLLAERLKFLEGILAIFKYS